MQEAFIKASIIRHHDHFDHHSVGVGDKDNLKFGQVYFHHFSTSRLRSALIVYTYNSLFVVFLLLPCSICLSDLQYFSSLGLWPASSHISSALAFPSLSPFYISHPFNFPAISFLYFRALLQIFTFLEPHHIIDLENCGHGRNSPTDAIGWCLERNKSCPPPPPPRTPGPPQCHCYKPFIFLSLQCSLYTLFLHPLKHLCTFSQTLTPP